MCRCLTETRQRRLRSVNRAGVARAKFPDLKAVCAMALYIRYPPITSARGTKGRPGLLRPGRTSIIALAEECDDGQEDRDHA